MPKRLHECAPIVDVIHADSASAAVNGGWVDMQQAEEILFLINVGDIASGGTVDAKVQQAKTSSGGSAKDISGAAITQLTQADGDSDSVVGISVHVEKLDIANDFRYARLTVTPASAAAEFAAIALHFGIGYEPGDESEYEELVVV